LNPQLVKGLESLGVNHRPLFNPADLVLFGPHPEKAAILFQHFQSLAVAYLGHVVRDGGYPVMQVHLPRRNINRIMPFVAEVAAP
jgi:hypothetical protein